MIRYAWKAEFSQEELKRIEGCHQELARSEFSHIGKLEQLVKEMANALDRYEAILNEMEKETTNE